MAGLSAAHLRKLADDLEAEERGEADKQLREEIAELKAKVAGATPDEKRAAVDQITDEEWAVIKQHRTGKTAPPAPDPDDEDEDDEGKKKTRKRYRPGRKSGSPYNWDLDENGNRVELDVVRIYSGDDEDDRVELGKDAEGW